jgi:hypothetical protein
MAVIDIPPSGESKSTSTTEVSKSGETNAIVPTDHMESKMESNASPNVENDTVADEKAKAADTSEEDMEYPQGFKLWVILSALCLAIFLVALDQTIISTAIPKITDHFDSIRDIVSVSIIPSILHSW